MRCADHLSAVESLTCVPRLCPVRWLTAGASLDLRESDARVPWRLHMAVL